MIAIEGFMGARPRWISCCRLYRTRSLVVPSISCCCAKPVQPNHRLSTQAADGVSLTSSMMLQQLCHGASCPVGVGHGCISGRAQAGMVFTSRES